MLERHVRLLGAEPVMLPEADGDRLALVRRSRREISDLLATEGYFTPQIRFDRSEGEAWQVVVEPGGRARITAVDLDFAGALVTEPERERDALEKGLDALMARVGVKPLGYRSPAGEVSYHVAEMLKEKGFLYDSSMLDDIFPYRSTLRNGEPGVVESPWSWTLDDAIYLLFSIKNPRSVFTNDHILKIWTDEFDAIYKWGGVFNLVMHPQVIGRPSRLELLRSFINYARKFDGVVFAQAGDLARWFVDNEPPFEPRRFPIRPTGA